MTLINGRFLTRPATGVDRMAIELLAALAPDAVQRMQLKAVIPYRASIHPSAGQPNFPLKNAGRLSGHLWEQLALSRLAGERPLVNLCNTAPMLRHQQLVVIHDAGTAANAANYSRSFRAWYAAMHSSVLRRARVVATVSRFSADELVRVYGRRARGLEVLTESGEHILRPVAEASILDRLGIRDQPYVLALGSASANKNFAAVASAASLLSHLPLAFVVAGGENSRVFQAQNVVSTQLKRAGYVTDSELRALYEHALCFVFPSLYEGFGVPPLEAMHCGCPVVASDRASIPEVCGDAVLYCDPTDPTTLAAQIRRLFESSALQSDLRSSGYARAAQFTWRRAAEQFESIMRCEFT